jgi:Family of unknown function (DUF5996)
VRSVPDEHATTSTVWPELAFEPWADTRETLHLWTQVAGKVKLALCPFLNHWWEVAFELTASGLGSGLIPWRGTSFELEFDFLDHQLAIRTSEGQRRAVALAPRSVASFHAEVMEALGSLGIEPQISSLPAELPDPVPFERDEQHSAYDGEAVQRWWRACLATERAMQRFRTPFHGKSSPVYFYWGGCDLSTTRFNGRPMSPPAGAGRIFEYAEDRENFAIGLWPGSREFPHAVLYAYLSPAPDGIAAATVEPAAARWEPALSEFVLLYEDARRAPSPDGAVQRFFQSAYEASAELAGWDRAALEGHVPELPPADGGG